MYNLQRFDVSRMKPSSTVVIIGKRVTGKTVLALDVLFNSRDIPFGRIMCPMSPVVTNAEQQYTSLVPSEFLHEEVDPEVLCGFVQRQTVMSQASRDQKIFGSASIDPRAFLLLDSCLYDRESSMNAHDVLIKGRELNCLLIVCMQYAFGLPPTLQQNIDYVFILRENLLNNRKRLYDRYGEMFPTFQTFCTVLDACSDSYECLVIDQKKRAYWYKADLHPRFFMGQLPVVRSDFI